MAFDKNITRWLNENGRDIIARICFRKKDDDKFFYLFALEDGVLVAAEKGNWLTKEKNEYAFLPYAIMTDCDGYTEVGILNIGHLHIRCDFQKEDTLENLGSNHHFLSLKSRDVNQGGYMSKEETRNVQNAILKEHCDHAKVHFENMDILNADDLYEDWRLFAHRRSDEAQTFINSVRERIGLKPIGDFFPGRYFERFGAAGRNSRSLMESAIEQAGDVFQSVTGTSRSNKPAQTDTPLDQIKKLAELRDAGVLTNEEFEAKKKELLGKI